MSHVPTQGCLTQPPRGRAQPQAQPLPARAQAQPPMQAPGGQRVSVSASARHARRDASIRARTGDGRGRTLAGGGDGAASSSTPRFVPTAGGADACSPSTMPHGRSAEERGRACDRQCAKIILPDVRVRVFDFSVSQHTSPSPCRRWLLMNVTPGPRSCACWCVRPLYAPRASCDASRAQVSPAGAVNSDGSVKQEFFKPQKARGS